MSGDEHAHRRAAARRGARAPSTRPSSRSPRPSASRSTTGSVASSRPTSSPPRRVPAHDNAAMDGYALRGSADTRARRADASWDLARAGHPYARPGRPGDLRADPHRRRDAGRLRRRRRAGRCRRRRRPRRRRPTRSPAGRHRRTRGRGPRAGRDRAAARGRRLAPSDLGLAASIGVDDAARSSGAPRVAVFSTGDELREIGAAARRAARSATATATR